MSSPLLAGWVVILECSGWMYSAVMHGRYGQTVGKMAAGVKVLDVSETPISMRQAFLRDSPWILFSILVLPRELRLILGGATLDEVYASPTVTGLSFAAVLWFLIEIVTLLTNDKRRAVHDFLAATVVVKVDPPPLPRPAQP